MRSLARFVVTAVVTAQALLVPCPASAQKETALAITFDVQTGEEPENVCVIAVRIADSEAVSTALGAVSKGDPPRCATSPPKTSKAGAALQLSTDGYAAVGATCNPGLQLDAKVCNVENHYQVACTSSHPSGRTAFVVLEDDNSDTNFSAPSLSGGRTVKVPFTKNRTKFNIAVAGGDYEPQPLKYVTPEVAGGYSADLRLVARCSARPLEFPPSVSGGGTIFLGDKETKFADVRAPIKVVVGSNDHLTVHVGATELAASWPAAPPETIALGYQKVHFTWKPHPLYSGDRCPTPEDPHRSSGECSPDKCGNDVASGVCKYTCTAGAATAVALPIDLTFRSVASTTPEVNPQTWTDRVTEPDASLEGFVRPEDRRLRVKFAAWATLASPNRPRRIALGLPNGTTVELDPRAQGAAQLVDAHGIENGQSIHVDPRGERLFHEGEVDVKGPVVDLSRCANPEGRCATPDAITPRLSASVLIGPLFEWNGPGLGLPISYAGSANVDVSHRGTDSSWSYGLLTTYWLEGNRGFFSVHAPNDASSADTVPYNRLFAQFAVSHYFSSIASIGWAVGPGISWTVKDAAAGLVGGARPTALQSAFLRVKIVTPFWAEGGVSAIVPETYYRFSSSDFHGDAKKSMIVGGGAAVYLGVRVGNHTL